MIVRKLFDGVFSFERGPADVLPTGVAQHHVQVPQEQTDITGARTQKHPAAHHGSSQTPSDGV